MRQERMKSIRRMKKERMAAPTQRSRAAQEAGRDVARNAETPKRTRSALTMYRYLMGLLGRNRCAPERWEQARQAGRQLENRNEGWSAVSSSRGGEQRAADRDAPVQRAGQGAQGSAERARTGAQS
jgi:hypothetical protein